MTRSSVISKGLLCEGWGRGKLGDGTSVVCATLNGRRTPAAARRPAVPGRLHAAPLPNPVGQCAGPAPVPNRRRLRLRLPNGAQHPPRLRTAGVSLLGASLHPTQIGPTAAGRAAGRALTRAAAPKPARLWPCPEPLDAAVGRRSLLPARP